MFWYGRFVAQDGSDSAEGAAAWDIDDERWAVVAQVLLGGPILSRDVAAAAVVAAVDALTDRERSVLYAYMVEGRSLRDVERVLDLGKSTVARELDAALRFVALRLHQLPQAAAAMGRPLKDVAGVSVPLYDALREAGVVTAADLLWRPTQELDAVLRGLPTVRRREVHKVRSEHLRTLHAALRAAWRREPAS